MWILIAGLARGRESWRDVDDPRDRESEIADYVDSTQLAETAATSSRLTVLGLQMPRRAAGRSAAAVPSLVAWAGQLPADVNMARLALPADSSVTGTTDEYATWVGDCDPGARLATAGSVEAWPAHRLDRETLCRLAGT